MTRTRWTAGNARGVAHAHVSGRTLCHAPAIAERYAWQELTRCPDCSRAAAALRPQSSGRVSAAWVADRARTLGDTPGPRAGAPPETER